ncbi:antibiotic biosynthesis monooxygenase family protein [Rhizobium sp. ZPR3]|uniref:Antibiotic biosynthesis monooxygenase family protein n=2 Tax=unclassified Rhizobium TaxID=2613769 RepID=A0AAU7SRE2_9HYPH
MIIERARLSIKPELADAFGDIFEDVAPLFLAAKGCKGVRFERSIEEPATYYLVVDWETLEDHMVVFRGSDDFQKWRAAAGGFFAAPPLVEHVSVTKSASV